MKPSSCVTTVTRTSFTRFVGVLMRTAIAASSVCLSLSGLSEAADTEPPNTKETHIPAEDLSTALLALGEDRHVEMIFVAEDVNGVRTRGASGNFTLEEALDRILSGTGLTYHYIDRATVTIVPARGISRAEGLNRAQVRSGGSDPGPRRGTAGNTAALDEIVVTARKRQEGMRDVPFTVRAVSAATLEDWGATQLSDYATYVPGLTVVQGRAPGQDMLILHGLNTPTPTALVGTYIDDTPVGASSAPQVSIRHALDLLPYDLERIEVLEGPQGTLYGANTMGGLVKYVTREPDLEGFAGWVGADLDENAHASAVGWNAHGALNVPIVTGKAAVRVSLSDDFAPGFIDEPRQGRTDGNQAKTQAGHITLQAKPSEGWSVGISAMVQYLRSPEGTSITLAPATLTPDSGRLSNSQAVPQTFESRLQYYSTNISGDLRWATLIYAGSYSGTRSAEWYEGYYPMDHAADPRTGRANQGVQLSLNKVTQELRLVSPAGGRIAWLLGGFFTDEQGHQVQSSYALDNSNIAVSDPDINPGIRIFIPSRYREYALFGDLTWKPTRAFAVTAGIRESRNEQTFAGVPACSPYYVSVVGLCPAPGAGASHQNVFNFAIGPSYHFSPDVMAYLRVASGYRPGGPNVPAPGIPNRVAADTLIDSELGIKSAWFGRRLRVDAAAYQIDWKNIQIIETAQAPLSINYGANGNTAKVRGFEAATMFAPTPNLQLGWNLTYTHAVLSAPMPASSTLVGDRGDRIPFVPIWSGSVTADYTRALNDRWAGKLGAGWHYTGQRYTSINNPGNCPLNCAGAPNVPSLAPYGVFDLHASVSNASWKVLFSVRNLTNKYALVDMSGGGELPFDVAPTIATVLSGRLFKLGVDRTF